MLTPVYTRRIVIFSSLFAAVCAGYIAGQRGLPLLPRSAGHSFSQTQGANPDNPEAITPNYKGEGLTVAFKPAPTSAVPRDASVEALLALTDTKTWELVIRPAPSVKHVHFRLEMREAGKAPEILCESTIGVDYPAEEAGKTKNVVASLMPADGTLSTAKKLRTRIALQGSAVSQDSANPFHNFSTMGTVDSRDDLPSKNTSADGAKPAEVKLVEATFGQDAKSSRKKILYLTFQARYDR